MLTPHAARVRLYTAVSLDGFIADESGGIGWLNPFNDVDYGYAAFLATIGVLIEGRATYEQCLTFGEWPYPGKRTIVLTTRPLPEPRPAGVEPSTLAPAALVAKLRTELADSDGAAGSAGCSGRDIWLVGGGVVNGAFLAADAIDELDLFTIPLGLGRGRPLFGENSATAAARLTERRWRLERSQDYPNGVTRRVYGRVVAGPGGG